MKQRLVFIVVLLFSFSLAFNHGQQKSPLVRMNFIEDIAKYSEASRTDDELAQRSEEAIRRDGFNSEDFQSLRETSEKHEFQSEVQRMMRIIINSLYKNAEIFLRELISNASDALDKIRFLSIVKPESVQDNDEFSIRIFIDRIHRIIHVMDTGIGMTKQHLIEYLGTISKSSTEEFFRQNNENQTNGGSNEENIDLIGRFGLGFYSSFLVADRVTVTTKHNDDLQYIWQSDAESFRVFLDPRGNTLGRGTIVSLHLKNDADEYLDRLTLQNIILRYSQFINFDIFLALNDSIDGDLTDRNDRNSIQWELINLSKPVWLRRSTDVTDDEYKRFFTVLTGQSEEPFTFSHFSIEGEINFRAIIYVPRRPSSKLFLRRNQKNTAIKFYVRRVFITDFTEEILPKHFSFICGVIDVDDFSLNLSRETFQRSIINEKIKKKILQKVFQMFEKISAEMFPLFWREYGTNIKLGIIEDAEHRNHLANLLRFTSSISTEKQISLNEYIQRMKSDQNNIYFIMTRSIEQAEKSPFIENLVRIGHEILYLIDPIDQYCVQALEEYQGKRFLNLAKDKLELNVSNWILQKKKRQLEIIYQPLIRWFRETFSETVSDVIISDRLFTTSMILIAGHFGYDGYMERLARIQTYSTIEKNSVMEHYFKQKRTIEINPFHPLMKYFLRLIRSDKDNFLIREYGTLMYEIAMLRSGYDLNDLFVFINRLESMLYRALEVNPEATTVASSSN